MAFGDFARLDDYDPDAGFKDTFASRFGAAPLDAGEAAMLRQRQFTNRPSTTSQETIDKLAGAASDVLIPKTPLDVAATIALGPVGRVPARIGALALGGLLQSDEAQAGPVSKAIGAVLAPLRGKPGGPWEGGIRAYHSSPHDFEKVDFSKLRTGEGANVYGAGHYMAENPAVSGQGGQYWQQFLPRFSGTEFDAAGRLEAAKFDRATASDQLRSRITALKDRADRLRGPERVATENIAERYQNVLDRLESGQPVGPRTYEMNLRAKPEELLDWDKAFGAQPRDVQKRLLSVSPSFGLGGDRPIGVFAAEPLKNPATAEKLAREGIPGIRYLDEGSRNAPISSMGIKALEGRLKQYKADLAGGFGDPERMKYNIASIERELASYKPTYNYVGVDPSKLDILAKYGLAGGATGFGTLAAQDNYRKD